MDMIDRTAEGLRCGELGQGVALLFFLIVPILSLSLFSLSSLIAIVSRSNFSQFFLVLFRLLCHFALSFGDFPHIKVTWSFLFYTALFKRHNT